MYVSFSGISQYGYLNNSELFSQSANSSKSDLNSSSDSLFGTPRKEVSDKDFISAFKRTVVGKGQPKLSAPRKRPASEDLKTSMKRFLDDRQKHSLLNSFKIATQTSEMHRRNHEKKAVDSVDEEILIPVNDTDENNDKILNVAENNNEKKVINIENKKTKECLDQSSSNLVDEFEEVLVPAPEKDNLKEKVDKKPSLLESIKISHKAKSQQSIWTKCSQLKEDDCDQVLIPNPDQNNLNSNDLPQPEMISFDKLNAEMSTKSSSTPKKLPENPQIQRGSEIVSSESINNIRLKSKSENEASNELRTAENHEATETVSTDKNSIWTMHGDKTVEIDMTQSLKESSIEAEITYDDEYNSENKNEKITSEIKFSMEDLKNFYRTKKSKCLLVILGCYVFFYKNKVVLFQTEELHVTYDDHIKHV